MQKLRGLSFGPRCRGSVADSETWGETHPVLGRQGRRTQNSGLPRPQIIYSAWKQIKTMPRSKIHDSKYSKEAEGQQLSGHI